QVEQIGDSGLNPFSSALSPKPDFFSPQLSLPVAKSPVAVWILPPGFNLEKEDKSVNATNLR
ncbi:MAG TPA: hypothetical protein PLB18_12090, partial [Acidobacteriota bacterium]|nr:hypothetical protein [Acidobacteriota bacterium]